MTKDNRHIVDLYADAKAADADYRAAERKKAAGLDLPYLVTINFENRSDAFEFIESVKAHGGVLVGDVDGMPDILHAGVMDFREWGGSSEIFPNRPEV